jgi:hypothetical protein
MTGHAAAGPQALAGHGAGLWRYRVLHHLLAAALMASAMLALEKVRWMDWLDAVMLNIVGTEAPTATSQPAGLPQLVLIDVQAYAERFGARSPLDRTALSELLGELLSVRPTSLLVDLQLEPAPDEPRPRDLDQRLATAARPQPGGAGVRITLPLPVARTPALDQGSIQWMRQQCEAGIQFGSAEVRSHFGSVVRLDQDPLSLAQVARPSAVPAHGEHSGRGAEPHVTLCDLARNGATLEVIWGLLGSTDQHHQSAPLAPALVKQLVASSIAWRPGQTAARLQTGGQLVVGGAYDSQDRFITSAMAAPVPGALLHASALVNSGRDGHHALAWIADVLLGTLLGLGFSALWAWVGHAELQSAHWRWRDVVRSWAVPVKALVPWLAAALIGYGLMKAAGWLMAHSFWLNPGPMVLGMLLHTLLLKDEEEHPMAHWRSYTQHHPTWPLQGLMILAGLAFGLSGHH